MTLHQVLIHMRPGCSSTWGIMCHLVHKGGISSNEPKVLGSPYCSRSLVCFMRSRRTDHLCTIKHKWNTESNKVIPFACRPLRDTSFNVQYEHIKGWLVWLSIHFYHYDISHLFPHLNCHLCETGVGFYILINAYYGLNPCALTRAFDMTCEVGCMSHEK